MRQSCCKYFWRKNIHEILLLIKKGATIKAMSKRNSTGPSNTLFNYFTKTPPTNKKVKSVNNSPQINEETAVDNDFKKESKYYIIST